MTNTKRTYTIIDNGDPDVGLYGGTYEVDVILNDISLDDEDSIAFLDTEMKKTLTALYDGGNRTEVLTQDEVAEREREYEEMIRWEEEQEMQQQQYKESIGYIE